MMRSRRRRPAGSPGPTSGSSRATPTCVANQALHGEAVNLLAKIRANSHYVPTVADPLAPITFVDKINVPVYMACQWTDEQTGRPLPGPGGALHRHPTQVVHVHERHPRRLARPGDLQPLVRLPAAVRRPACRRSSAARPCGRPRRWSTRRRSGSTGSRCRRTRSSNSRRTTRALAAFQALQPIRVLFDNGAGGPQHPGNPSPGFEHSFPRFPIPGTQARSWYLSRTERWRRASRPARVMPASPGTRTPGRSPTSPATPRRGRTDCGRRLPPYHWLAPPTGSAVSFTTSPLASNTTVIGAGAVHVWVKASTPNVDLQATISEIRPDGKETFVQNGWVRANERKLDRLQEHAARARAEPAGV